MTEQEAERAQEAGRTLATASLTALLEGIGGIFAGDANKNMRSATTMIAFAYIEVYLEVVTDHLSPPERQVHDTMLDIMRDEQRFVFEKTFKR